MSLGKQATTGAIWNYVSFLASKGLLLVATIILAQVLNQDEIGLMSMALLVILVFDLFRDFGTGPALIHRQRDVKEATEVAFIISAALGVGLFILNWLLAPLTAQFFDTNNAEQTALLTTMVQVLGFSLLFAALSSTQDHLLQKEIKFNRRMIPEVGRTLVKGGLQVGLALSGFGVWSLVIGQVVGEFVALVLLWALSSWRPTFRFDRALFRPMARYGLEIVLVDALGTFVANLDYFIIGRLLGPTPLALYSYAFRIPEMVLVNLSHAVSNVAFSVVSRLQDDLDAMREAYLTMQSYMLMILAPLGLGLFSCAPTIVHVLFKPNWWPIIVPMQILTIYMVLGGINHWPGVVYKAVGRPDILRSLSFVKLMMLIPTLWIGATFDGIEGVAWGLVIVRVIGIVIDMIVVSRFVHVTLWRNFQVIWPPMVAAILMALVVHGVFLLFDAAEHSIPVLIVAVAVGAVVYTIVIWLLNRTAVEAMFALLRSLLDRRRPAPAEG